MKKHFVIYILLLASLVSFAQVETTSIGELPEKDTIVGADMIFIEDDSAYSYHATMNSIFGWIQDSISSSIPMTATTTNYTSSSGSEAVAFVDLNISNDTLFLGSALTRSGDQIFVARTDYTNSVVITGTPGMYYKSVGYTTFLLSKTMTGAIIQSDGNAWYIIGVFYDFYYRQTLAAFPDSASVGGYTAKERLTVGGAVSIGNTAANNEGTIKYDGDEFSGYDGATWVPFNNHFTRESEILTPVYDVDKVTESSLNDPFYNLVYWKKDFINANFYSVDNAKIGFIGDSYTLPYSEKLKKECESIYGYGGGYEALISNVGYADYGTYVTGWTFVSIRTDPYVIHSRAARSLGAGNVLKLSANEFNLVKLHYRTRSSGGSFSVKRGSSGTPVSVSTAAADGDSWYVVDYGAVTYNIYDTIFVTSTTADTIDIYGFQFEMNPYSEVANFETQNKRLEVSIMGDGGANLDDFYTDKDTATMHQLLDSLDLSLMCIVNLDAPSTIATTLDSLIGLFRILRPEMDIAVLSSHDDKGGYGDSTKAIMEKVAKINKAAYIDVFNSVGERDNLYATGATTDSVHLAGFGKYLLYYAIRNKLFPDPTEMDQLTVYSLKLMGNRAIVKPNGRNFIFTTKPLKSIFTGTDNASYGYRSLEANTTGYSNIAIGSEGLIANTTGYSNISIGYNGLHANTEGHENIAIGASALNSKTTTHNNIAIGTQSLYSLLTGTGNTAVGDRTLIINTGSYNTATGFEALKYPTGNNNTAVGMYALRGAAAGSNAADNSAFGKYCLYGVTSGALNSCFGFYTGQAITTGSGNSAFGYNSLYTNLIGNYNTAFGYKAAYVITGSGNVWIGNEAGNNAVFGSESNMGGLDNSNTAFPLLRWDFTADSTRNNGDFIVRDQFSVGGAAKNEYYLNGNDLVMRNLVSDGDLNLGINRGGSSANVVTIDGATKYVTFSDLIILSPMTKPGAGTEVDGMIYNDSGDNHLWFWNGAAWVQLDN